MRILFYESIVSPHQMPLCNALADKLGEGNFCYCATASISEERRKLGWDEEARPWITKREGGLGTEEISRFAKEFDVLFTWLLDPQLIAGFTEAGKKVVYASERYFKPPFGMIGRLPFQEKRSRMSLASGLMRSCKRFLYLPTGIHAARDMARLCGLYNGDMRCLLNAPELGFDKKPGGRIEVRGQSLVDSRQYCLDKMRMWGYFVAPSKNNAPSAPEASNTSADEIKVLWVGRLLEWKRVDTIVRAVGKHADLKRVDNSLPKITLDIYGSGPEEKRLKNLAVRYVDVINFYPPVPMDDVRKLMREHDVYVLSSNGYEGWGAVVSEAMEEDMRIVGTYEAGSSATMLSDDCLFHAGDVDGLRRKLCQASSKKRRSENLWSARNAADIFMEMCNE